MVAMVERSLKKDMYEKINFRKKEQEKNPDKYFEKGFRDGKRISYEQAKEEVSKYLNEPNLSNRLPYNKGILMKAASKLIDSENPKDIKDAIKVYEAFKAKHLPKRIKEKLGYAEKKNSRTLEEKVETKIVAGIFGTCIVTGLFFGLSTITGNSVGITTHSSNFLGIVLFVGGITGLFFCKKK